jgi:hypothetical protein
LRFYGANATSRLFRDGLNFGTNRDRGGSQQLRPRDPDLFYGEIRTVMTLRGKRDDITATITNYEAPSTIPHRATVVETGGPPQTRRAGRPCANLPAPTHQGGSFDLASDAKFPQLHLRIGVLLNQRLFWRHCPMRLIPVICAPALAQRKAATRVLGGGEVGNGGTKKS